MRVASYNIQWGMGRDGRIDLQRIADTIGGADIVALQEVERNWRPQHYPDQAERLAALLPEHHWVYGPAVDLAGPGRGGRRQIGNMVLSRHPIWSTRTLPLPSATFAGHVNDTQSLLEAVIDVGHGLRIYNFHLNYLGPSLRQAQLAAALAFIAEAPGQGGAISMPGRDSLGPEDDWIVLPDGRPPPMPESAILLGDFNCPPDSPEYQSLSSRYTDVLAWCGAGNGTLVTFPGNDREPPQHLDHCFVSQDLAPLVNTAWVDAAATGSDHQPVWLDIAMAG
jgi:endonuclease/exonuclease/phosphatase family metal-dependent hydrolase